MGVAEVLSNCSGEHTVKASHERSLVGVAELLSYCSELQTVKALQVRSANAVAAVASYSLAVQFVSAVRPWALSRWPAPHVLSQNTTRGVIKVNNIGHITRVKMIDLRHHHITVSGTHNFTTYLVIALFVNA